MGKMPETKIMPSGWTIQWNDTWKGGSYVCYLGDCLMMSAPTMAEAESKVNETMERISK